MTDPKAPEGTGPDDPAPPWLTQLDKRLGPNPTLAEVATRIAASSMPVAKSYDGLARASVDLAAQILREIKQATVNDPETGKELATLQICDQGLYWATVHEGSRTTVLATSREEVTAKVLADVREHLKKHPRPHPVIKGGAG